MSLAIQTKQVQEWKDVEFHSERAKWWRAMAAFWREMQATYARSPTALKITVDIRRCESVARKHEEIIRDYANQCELA